MSGGKRHTERKSLKGRVPQCYQNSTFGITSESEAGFKDDVRPRLPS